MFQLQPPLVCHQSSGPKVYLAEKKQSFQDILVPKNPSFAQISIRKAPFSWTSLSYP